MDIVLENVRMPFESIYEPSVPRGAKPNTKPAYSARYVIEPGSDNERRIKDAIAKEAEEKWPGKGAQVLRKINEDKKSMFLEGEYCNADGEVYGGFEGTYSLGTRSEKLKPSVKNRFNEDVLPGQPQAPYAGSHVHVAVNIWAMDHETWGRRIGAVTQSVMFVSDGEPMGGTRPAPAGVFNAFAAEPTLELEKDSSAEGLV